MEAQWWHPLSDGRVSCDLCPFACTLRAGQNGPCGTRGNRDGRLKVLNYGRIVALGIDPVEKKPLYHFRPGTTILSTAAPGCNLHCLFCQNSEISQRVDVSTREMTPQSLVDIALTQGSRAIAFTYSEPLVWFEYVVDAARLLRAAGTRVVLVTNGMINAEPLAELLPLVDAMNIDLKAMRPEFYRDYVGGDLATVLATIRAARACCHVELTNLLIPGRNDSDDDIDRLVVFVAGLGQSTPLHFSRFFPRFRATEDATPADTLVRAAERASARLYYVYLGNIDCGVRWRDALCPQCGNRLVDRSAYAGRSVGIASGNCDSCGRSVDIVLDAGGCA